MSEDALSISVFEAAKDFLKVLEQVEKTGQPAVLVRNGQAVAELLPVVSPRSAPTTPGDLIDRWRKIRRLPPEEAESFARDLDAIHRNQPPLESAWG